MVGWGKRGRLGGRALHGLRHNVARTTVRVAHSASTRPAEAPPALCHIKYFDEYLKRCLLKVFSAPQRSVERQQFRLAALRECHTCTFR